MTFRVRLVRAARTLAIVYLGVLLVMVIFEEKLIFFPNAGPPSDWKPPGLTFEDAHFQAPDGARLHGWYVPHPSPRVTVLFAHGNAGNLTLRAGVLHQLHALGADVLIFDYRGYGKSEGSPNEAGILSDTRAARAWLSAKTGVAQNEIILMGRSLGGGVMVDLAAQDGAGGLVLESTFTSLPDVAARVYPWLPVRWLMRNRLESIGKIGDYKGPLLQSHGDADTLIPFDLGEQLFAAAGSRDKQFFVLKGRDHNDRQTPAYYQALDAFFDRVSQQ